MNVKAVVACLVGLLVAGSASSVMAQQAESQLQLVAELHTIQRCSPSLRV